VIFGASADRVLALLGTALPPFSLLLREIISNRALFSAESLKSRTKEQRNNSERTKTACSPALQVWAQRQRPEYVNQPGPSPFSGLARRGKRRAETPRGPGLGEKPRQTRLYPDLPQAGQREAGGCPTERAWPASG